MSDSVRHLESDQNGYESDFGDERKAAETLDFSQARLEQSCSQRCPHQHGPSLGEALGIAEVAELLGCSAWTVRQKYLPQGLPHVRASRAGKIVFFKTQVIAWIVQRQLRKGG